MRPFPPRRNILIYVLSKQEEIYIFSELHVIKYEGLQGLTGLVIRLTFLLYEYIKSRFMSYFILYYKYVRNKAYMNIGFQTYYLTWTDNTFSLTTLKFP